MRDQSSVSSWWIFDSTMCRSGNKTEGSDNCCGFFINSLGGAVGDEDRNVCGSVETKRKYNTEISLLCEK